MLDELLPASSIVPEFGSNHSLRVALDERISGKLFYSRRALINRPHNHWSPIKARHKVPTFFVNSSCPDDPSRDIGDLCSGAVRFVPVDKYTTHCPIFEDHTDFLFWELFCNSHMNKAFFVPTVKNAYHLNSALYQFWLQTGR